jgi:hypothetical protein
LHSRPKEGSTFEEGPEDVATGIRAPTTLTRCSNFSSVQRTHRGRKKIKGLVEEASRFSDLCVKCAYFSPFARTLLALSAILTVEEPLPGGTFVLCLQYFAGKTRRIEVDVSSGNRTYGGCLEVHDEIDVPVNPERGIS